MVHEIALQLGIIGEISRRARARARGFRLPRAFPRKENGRKNPLTRRDIGYAANDSTTSANRRASLLLLLSPISAQVPSFRSARSAAKRRGVARARVKTRKNAAVTAYARGYRGDNSRGSASKLHARLRGAPGFRLRREHPLDLQLELDARRPEQARSRTAVGGITYY